MMLLLLNILQAATGMLMQSVLFCCRDICPVTMDYETMKDSLYNTPPCWSIYMCSLMFDFLLEQGGLEAREQLNQKKADILYSIVDSSNGFYAAPVHESVRSRMNVPFIIPSKPELEKEFVAEAAKLGMVTSMCPSPPPPPLPPGGGPPLPSLWERSLHRHGHGRVYSRSSLLLTLFPACSCRITSAPLCCRHTYATDYGLILPSNI